MGSGKPSPRLVKNFPLVWITSTNGASLLSKSKVKSSVLKHGCAGSNPVILSIFHFFGNFNTAFAAKLHMWAPILWPTKYNFPHSFSDGPLEFIVALPMCSKRL